MKKSDLRTGYRVTLRNGERYIVLLNCKHRFDYAENILLNAKQYEWRTLGYFNDDLTHIDYSSEDIVKIEEPSHIYAILKENSSDYPYETIWTRQKPKEMTLADIEAILGYSVKIIGEE